MRSCSFSSLNSLLTPFAAYFRERNVLLSVFSAACCGAGSEKRRNYCSLGTGLSGGRVVPLAVFHYFHYSVQLLCLHTGGSDDLTGEGYRVKQPSSIPFPFVDAVNVRYSRRRDNYQLFIQIRPRRAPPRCRQNCLHLSGVLKLRVYTWCSSGIGFRSRYSFLVKTFGLANSISIVTVMWDFNNRGERWHTRGWGIQKYNLIACCHASLVAR